MLLFVADGPTGQSEPAPSGRVIKILSLSDGAANLDSNGDGTADTAAQLAALGISDAERQELCGRYGAGQALWRVPIPHFSKVDANWPGGPRGSAGAPNAGPPKPTKQPDNVDDPPNV